MDTKLLELMPVIKKEREDYDVEEVAVSPEKPRRKENGQSNGQVRSIQEKEEIL